MKICLLLEAPTLDNATVVIVLLNAERLNIAFSGHVKGCFVSS